MIKIEKDNNKQELSTEEDLCPIFRVRLNALKELNPELFDEYKEILVKSSLAAQDAIQEMLPQIPETVNSLNDFMGFVKSSAKNENTTVGPKTVLKFTKSHGLNSSDNEFLYGDDNTTYAIKASVSLTLGYIDDLYNEIISKDGAIINPNKFQESKVMEAPQRILDFGGMEEVEFIPNQAKKTMGKVRSINSNSQSLEKE